jgi:hypothetical protein
MMESIQDYYDKNASKVTGAKVRGIVRNYLKSEPDEQRRNVEGLSGENLRGKAGGIYFIPARHVDQLSALAEALPSCTSARRTCTRCRWPTTPASARSSVVTTSPTRGRR